MKARWKTNLIGTERIYSYTPALWFGNPWMPKTVVLKVDSKYGRVRSLYVFKKISSLSSDASKFLEEHGFGPDEETGWQFLTTRRNKKTKKLLAFLETYSKL